MARVVGDVETTRSLMAMAARALSMPPSTGSSSARLWIADVICVGRAAVARAGVHLERDDRQPWVGVDEVLQRGNDGCGVGAAGQVHRDDPVAESQPAGRP